jgi:cell division septation protein DedD
VQVGAFTDKQNAEDLVKRLKASGFEAIIDFEAKK